MKNLMIVFVLIAALAVSSAAQADPLEAVQGTEAAVPAAIIRELTGTVEIKAPGQTDWVPASAGDILVKNSSLSTGFKSTAVLVLGNSTLIVRPLTRLSLEELVQTLSGEQVSLFLRSGRVHADVVPPAELRTEFTIQSPMATASVRGTSFEFDTLNVRVNSGTVSFSGAAGSRPVLVGAGAFSYVDESAGRAESVFNATQAEATLSSPLGGDTPAPHPGEAAPIITPPTSGNVGGTITW
jgi:hypothetical protein